MVKCTGKGKHVSVANVCTHPDTATILAARGTLFTNARSPNPSPVNMAVRYTSDNSPELGPSSPGKNARPYVPFLSPPHPPLVNYVRIQSLTGSRVLLEKKRFLDPVSCSLVGAFEEALFEEACRGSMNRLEEVL